MTRPSIIEILHSQKSQNQNEFEKNRLSAISMIEAGMVTRFFNKFAPPLPDSDMSLLKGRYEYILKHLDLDAVQRANLCIDDKKYIEEVKQFISDIATIGIAELLDTDHHIKSEFIDFLGLSNYRDRIKSSGFDLVSSYVGTIIMAIEVDEKAKCDQFPSAHVIINTCMNSNTKQWIIDTMKNPTPDRNINLAVKPSAGEQLSDFSVNHPVTTTAILGTLFGAAGLITSGIIAVANRYSSNKRSNQEEKFFEPPKP